MSVSHQYEFPRASFSQVTEKYSHSHVLLIISVLLLYSHCHLLLLFIIYALLYLATVHSSIKSTVGMFFGSLRRDTLWEYELLRRFMTLWICDGIFSVLSRTTVLFGVHWDHLHVFMIVTVLQTLMLIAYSTRVTRSTGRQWLTIFPCVFDWIVHFYS